MLKKKNRRTDAQPVPVSATVTMAPDGRMTIVLLIEPADALRFADRAVNIALDGQNRLRKPRRNTTRNRSQSGHG